MKRLFIFVLFVAFAVPAFAQHGATLAAIPNPGETYNFYRGASSTGPFVLLNPAPLLTPNFTDTTAPAGTTVWYTITGVLDIRESPFAPAISAVIPSDVPPATCPPLAVGCRIRVNATANIRHAPTSSTTLPALYGTEPTGALGTVLAISPFGYAPFGVPNWVQVKFDTCSSSIPQCTGWMGSDNMTIVTTPPPPPPPQPTLNMSCTPVSGGNTCVITTTNIPAGAPFTATFSEAGLSSTVTGVSK